MMRVAQICVGYNKGFAEELDRISQFIKIPHMGDTESLDQCG